MSTAPKYLHPQLKSLSEVQSEVEDPQCRCGAYEDAECDLRDVQRCIRKQLEEEYGVDDPSEYSAGRGMPRG